MYFDPHWEQWVGLAAGIAKQASLDVLLGARIARQYQAVQQELDAIAKELRRRPAPSRTARLKHRARQLRQQRIRLYAEFLEEIEAPRAAHYFSSPLWKLTAAVIQMDEAIMRPEFQQALELVREMDRQTPLAVREVSHR